MRPTSIKTFQDLCLVAYFWNMIVFIVLDVYEYSNKLAEDGKAAGTLIDHLGTLISVDGIFLIVLAPIMGLPFWLGLLVARRKSKIARYFLYTIEILLVFASIGAILQLSVNGFLEQQLIGLSVVIEMLLIGSALLFLLTPQSKQWLERY